VPYNSPMSAVLARGRRNIINIADSQAVDNPSGTKVLGTFQFNPNTFGEQATYLFQATISTSKGSITGSVQLYNVTDGEAVTGTLSTSSTSPNPESSSLTMGAAAGNLKDTTKTYEARISVTGADASDILSVGSIRILVL
jgi:hypothetical protein